jgi:cell wall-associated NlpC family hydrolase
LLALLATALLLVVPGVALASTPATGGNASLTARAAALQAQLDQQYAAMERLSERLDALTSAEQQVRDELTRMRRLERQVGARLAAAQRQLDDQARAAYIQGPGYYLSALVGVTDMADLLDRLPLQKAMLEADARVLEQVRDQKATVDQLNGRVAADLAQRQALRRQLVAEREQLKAAAGRLQASLKQLDGQLAGALATLQRQAEAAGRAAWASFAASLHGQGAAAYWQPGAAARAAVAFALRQLGKPYQWGATGPGSYDCSGLTWSAYRAAGVLLPRTAAAQYGAGVGHPGLGDLLAGDLLFYADDPANPATIHHVGMYLGNGLMVHAPHTGDVVRVATIWRAGYAGAVRVVPAVPKPGAQPPPSTSAPTTAPPMTTSPPATTAPAPSTTTTTTTTVPPSTAGTTSTRRSQSSTTSSAKPTTTTAPTTTTKASTTTAKG